MPEDDLSNLRRRIDAARGGDGSQNAPPPQSPASLALRYGGPVTALEGHASDLAYLKAIQQGGDLTALLCERGVGYVAAIQTREPSTSRFRLPVFDPAKTSFEGPTIELDRRDHAARIERDGAVLSVWRLGACWRNGYAAQDHRGAAL